MSIRNIIREELQKIFDGDFRENMMKEDSLEEDYPSSFDMEYFKSLGSFNARIKYCEEHLQRISSGSSRIVYKIDDQKVLKLAKNKAGVAQNELEFESAKYADLDGIVAEVFDGDENYLWIEMELARKLKKGDFKAITGFNFEDFAAAVNNHGIDSVTFKGNKMDVSKDVVEQMWDDEFVYGIFSYMPGYDVPPGDLMKTSSYGVVHKDGGDRVVLIDYGFNNGIHQNYYS